MSDALLHGKSGVKRLVGLEVVEDQVELFIQDDNGNVNSIFKPHRFWVLTNEKPAKNSARLKGDLHFKWGTQFKYRKEFEKSRTIFKNRDIDTYSVWNPEEACMIKDGYTFYRDMQPKELSIVSWDIETSGLDPYAPDAKIFLITTTHRRSCGFQYNTIFRIDEYRDEGQMIDDFCEFIRDANPSLIIGHNIISYDFPYLQARAEAWGMPLSMGRNQSNVEFNDYESKFRLDGTRDLLYKNVKIYGREVVDTYFLSVSFDVSKSIETYALKPLIKQLGFEKPGRQYYDAGLIKDNWDNLEEREKICQYAIEDAEDPIKLWDYMGPLYFHLCPNIPKPLSEILLSASGSKINGMMVRAYLQDGHSIPKADTMEKYEGAISFAVPGIYSNCFKIDLAALYPSIMIEYEVFDPDKDPNGYLLELVKIFRAKRLEYKRLANETGETIWKEMDTTAKSVLNSFYGFCGASGLNFNSLRCASFITEQGRNILEFTIKWASGEDLEKFVQKDEEEDDSESA